MFIGLILLIAFLVIAIIAQRKKSIARLITVGSRAPDFELPDQNGKVHRLSDHAGKHVVLVFYPIDSSPACSLEMARVSSGYAALQAAGADVFGISVQNGESHKKFCGKVGIPYPLLSDTQRAVSQAYGTTGSAKGVADRVTVIVDGSGKVAYIDPDVDRHPFSIPNLWIDWIKAGSSPA